VLPIGSTKWGVFASNEEILQKGEGDFSSRKWERKRKKEAGNPFSTDPILLKEPGEIYEWRKRSALVVWGNIKPSGGQKKVNLTHGTFGR